MDFVTIVDSLVTLTHGRKHQGVCEDWLLRAITVSSMKPLISEDSLDCLSWVLQIAEDLVDTKVTTRLDCRRRRLQFLWLLFETLGWRSQEELFDLDLRGIGMVFFYDWFVVTSIWRNGVRSKWSTIVIASHIVHGRCNASIPTLRNGFFVSSNRKSGDDFSELIPAVCGCQLLVLLFNPS